MKRNVHLMIFLLLPCYAGAADLFVDVTESSGLGFEHFNGMSGALYFPEMMGSGVALLSAALGSPCR